MLIEKPAYYTYCQNEKCESAQNCLRYISYTELTDESEEQSISVINPHHYPKEAEKCSFYVSSKKVKMAWGIKDLYKELPYDKAKSIKQLLLKKFGRTKYYRFYREELPVTPANQAMIKKIFSEHGIESEPAYTHYSQEFEWYKDR